MVHGFHMEIIQAHQVSTEKEKVLLGKVGQRVPSIFWGGGVKPAVIRDLGSTMDIFPTLLDMSNLSMVDDRVMDGVSLKNTLLNSEHVNRIKYILIIERICS